MGGSCVPGRPVTGGMWASRSGGCRDACGSGHVERTWCRFAGGVRGSAGKGDAEAFEGDDDVGRPRARCWNRTIVWRPVWAMVAAACSTRWRSCLGSATASAPSKHSGWAQAVRSWAISTSCSQAVVADEVVAGQVAQPGVFGGADAVLDVGAVAVAQLQRGDVGVGLVGDEHLMPEPFGGVEQAELGAGVRPFAAGDHPRAVAPVGGR